MNSGRLSRIANLMSHHIAVDPTNGQSPAGLNRGVDDVCIDGLFVPKTTAPHVQAMVANCTYEARPVSLVRKYVTPNHRVLEGGPGFGVVTRELTKRAALVVSVEANAALREYAVRNAPKAIVYNNYLSAEARRYMPRVYEGLGVAATSIDNVSAIDPRTLIREWHLNAIVLDVEGAEEGILCETNLDDIELIIAELHPHIYGWGVVKKTYSNLCDIGFWQRETITEAGLVHVVYTRAPYEPPIRA